MMRGSRKIRKRGSEAHSRRSARRRFSSGHASVPPAPSASPAPSLGYFCNTDAERSAGRILLADRGERLAETHQCFRAFVLCGYLFVDIERFPRPRRILLALKLTFAEPIMRCGISGSPVWFLQEHAQRLVRRRVIAAQT